MSNILLDERLIAFIPSLAREIGTNEAIVLQQINYWVQKSSKIHNGKRWVYNTTKEWVEKEFCFMSESTLKRTLSSLKSLGLIESKKLSKHTGYHVNYYSINESKVAEIDARIKKKKADELKESIVSDCTVIGSEWTNEQVNMTQSGTGQNDTTITESTSRLLTDIKDREKPKPKEEKFKPVKPDSVSEQTWNDLLTLRKTKRAVESKTAWARIDNAIAKAQQATGHTLENIFSYWVMRAWAGFDDSWYIKAHDNQQSNTTKGLTNEKHQSANSQHQPSHFDQLRAEAAAKYGNPQPDASDIRTVN